MSKLWRYIVGPAVGVWEGYAFARRDYDCYRAVLAGFLEGTTTGGGYVPMTCLSRPTLRAKSLMSPIPTRH